MTHFIVRVLTMSFLSKGLAQIIKPVLMGVLVGLVSFGLGLSLPAYADDGQMAGEYIAADGTDLTAVAECLPKDLSQPNLERALRESGNDFLQKVFSVEDNYRNYKLDDAEAEYLNCLESKGFVPQVER